MRGWSHIGITFLFFAITLPLQAQRNDKPKIVGQQEVISNQGLSVTITLSHLLVEDRDDWFYPWGFTLRIHEGANYIVSGNTITPASTFYGMLSVQVTVNDGEEDSNVYPFKIYINDVPDITAQATPTRTDRDQPVTVELSHVVVVDGDNSFPADFQLTVLPSYSNDYSVSGNRVTPRSGYTGTLSVPVKVNDGRADSPPFSLAISVGPVNASPVITGQLPLSTNEDETLLIQFSHLSVNDPDNAYPNGFSLRLHNGSHYTVSGVQVLPEANFAGKLSVNVSVHDGTSESNVFPLAITVRPANDPPEITKLEEDPLIYSMAKGPTVFTPLFEVSDPDNDSLSRAEVGFIPEDYSIGNDELLFDNMTTIKGSFDLGRGLLVLSGQAPVSAYIEAVRSIRYNYVLAAEVFRGSKTVFLRLSDGKAMGAAKSREITTSALVVKLDIPTAFTPNGDSANDTWKIKPLKLSDEITDAVVRIYNRFGKLMFEAVGFDKEWDGRLNGELLPADTYYYTIDFNQHASESNMKGIVAILR